MVLDLLTPPRGRGKHQITDKAVLLEAINSVLKAQRVAEIMRRLTPLSGLQEEILQRQGLGISLYGQLEIQEIGN